MQFRRVSHGRVRVAALLKGVEEDTVWPPWLGTHSQLNPPISFVRQTIPVYKRRRELSPQLSTHILAQFSHLLCKADEIIPVYKRRFDDVGAIVRSRAELQS